MKRVLFFSLALSAFIAQGKSYYIGIKGSDTNKGTKESPFEVLKNLSFNQ